MDLNKVKTDFEKNGYTKIQIIDKKKINFFKKCLGNIISKKLFDIDKNYYNICKNNLNKTLNEGMIFLEKKNHRYLVEIYNQVPKSNFFYSISSDKKLNKVVSYLLTNKKNNFPPIHFNSDTLRMDTPGINPYLYGWHRDNNSNIKNSNFIQMWMPVISDLTHKIGGLHIIEKSHLLNLETTHTDEEQRRLRKNLPIRAKFDSKIKFKGKVKEKVITANLGEVVLFKSSLLHKSGINKSKSKMRYVLNTFYHDMSFKNWNYKNLEQKKENLKY